ncbi:MAG: hypothetical protein ACI9DC_003770 [Gammaproteobacteria bacterium]
MRFNPWLRALTDASLCLKSAHKGLNIEHQPGIGDPTGARAALPLKDYALLRRYPFNRKTDSLPHKAIVEANASRHEMANHDEQAGEMTDYGLLPMLQHYENRRTYPRIEFRGDVIIAAAGKVLSGRLRALSAGGTQIRCSPQTARTLHPRGIFIAPGKGPIVMLRFDLPVDGERTTFAAEARLTYITPRSREEIAFGAEFTRVSLANKKILAGYIVSSMQPDLS